ncbi:uncharacterized protein LOC129787678 [Lutzomyia longipalpis]|uniref:uncharacterized protein LOC129787678 n=1 Tax=Lutzomyia longipalpis TaxID=7200 RepID=UPI00248419C9|nr:uncharacterized protein LOC129787678 [Lutzomyia longipalpis]
MADEETREENTGDRGVKRNYEESSVHTEIASADPVANDRTDGDSQGSQKKLKIDCIQETEEPEEPEQTKHHKDPTPESQEKQIQDQNVLSDVLEAQDCDQAKDHSENAAEINAGSSPQEREVGDRKDVPNQSVIEEEQRSSGLSEQVPDVADNAFNLQLIKAVKRNRSLYDPNDANYLNFMRRNQIWDKIASQLQSSGGVCKKTYGDLYQKFVKNFTILNTPVEHNQSPSATIEKFPYFNEMLFLAPMLKLSESQHFFETSHHREGRDEGVPFPKPPKRKRIRIPKESTRIALERKKEKKIMRAMQQIQKMEQKQKPEKQSVEGLNEYLNQIRSQTEASQMNSQAPDAAPFPFVLPQLAQCEPYFLYRHGENSTNQEDNVIGKSFADDVQINDRWGFVENAADVQDGSGIEFFFMGIAQQVKQANL